MGLGGVIVVGSANMDLDVQASHFPQKGETVLGRGFVARPGGQGASQAMAIGRLGGRVRLVAKVGNDPFGHEVLRTAQTCGVDTGLVIVDPAHETGVTFRTQDDAGAIASVVAPGANGALDAEEVRDVFLEENPTALLVGLEIPQDTAIAAIAAVPTDCIVVLNLSPALALEDDVLARVDYLVMNATAAEILTQIRPAGDPECLAVAEAFLRRGARNVVITLDEEGTFFANPQGGRHFSTLSLPSTDAGLLDDAFTGALTRFLAEGRPVDRCIYLANAAAALASERPVTLRRLKEHVPELF